MSTSSDDQLFWESSRLSSWVKTGSWTTVFTAIPLTVMSLHEIYVKTHEYESTYQVHLFAADLQKYLSSYQEKNEDYFRFLTRACGGLAKLSHFGVRMNGVLTLTLK